MDEGRIGALIETIYSSAFDEGGWEELLQTLHTPFHAATITSVAWRKRDTMPVFNATTFSDPSFVSDYETYYHTIDPGLSSFLTNIDAFGQLRVFTLFDVFPFDEYPKTEFYCDFAKHVDFGQSMMAIIDNGPQVFANIHMHRPLHGNEFSRQDKNLLAALSPHLNRGLRIHRELTGLRTKAELFETAFDALAATFLLNSAGRVVAQNKDAEEYCVTAVFLQYARGGWAPATRPMTQGWLRCWFRHSRALRQPKSCCADQLMPQPCGWPLHLRMAAPSPCSVILPRANKWRFW